MKIISYHSSHLWYISHLILWPILSWGSMFINGPIIRDAMWYGTIYYLAERASYTCAQHHQFKRAKQKKKEVKRGDGGKKVTG